MNKKLIKVCDEGSDVKTITKVTKGVNGGQHGITQRIQLFNKFYELLS
jgi:predicted chitinase